VSESGTPWRSIDVMDVTSALIVLAAGTAMSVLLLAIEVIHHQENFKTCGHDGITAEYSKNCAISHKRQQSANI
jgi:hypothetical protein